MILRIVRQSAREVFMRMLDGVDPEVVEEIQHAALHVTDIEGVTEVRVRWIGHRLHAEVNIAVDPKFSVTEAHNLGMEARHEILHHLPYLSNVIVHVDPIEKSGESFHRIEEHAHDQHQSHFHP